MAIMPIQDALFLLAESRERPMHVGGLQLFTPPEDAGPDFVRELWQRAVGQDEVRWELTRRPERSMVGLGPWRWVPERSLDLEYHVRHTALPHPGRIRELLALASRLHGTLLARSRPLWETTVVEGLSDGRFALYTKVHHAVVDGVAAMRMLEEALSTEPHRGEPPGLWAPRADVRSRQRDGDGTSLPDRLIGGAVNAARTVTGATQTAVRSLARAVLDEAEMLPYRAPRSMLNVTITGSRRFAADKWDLERVRAVAKAAEATINDVVMAMCGGALRRYLDQLGQLPDDPLVAMVPVSLRAKEGGSTAGNEIGLILCNLGTDIDDPEERFGVVRRSMDRGKLRLEGLTPQAIMLLSAASFAPLVFGPLFRFEPLRRPPFNLVVSNVPGPRQLLYYNGARMDGTYPASIPYDGQAMNVTVASYDGWLCFGLTGCRRSVPHLQRLLDHLEAAITELEEVAGVA